MIEKDIELLISNAMNKGISDIHILPGPKNYSIYFRYNGRLELVENRDIIWGEQAIAYFKFLANMDVGEKRKPQTGSAIFEIQNELVELRFSTISNFEIKESIVIRILRQQKGNLEDYSTIFPMDLQKILALIYRKSGLILFSGPVGSGKTTIIYHLLRERMHRESLQVITMEDPVEIVEPLFLQTQVNEKANINYELLIKSSLRHHPDVLIIGEIRDEETARMAIRGALTGHLMIATIHAKDSVGVIARLEELSVTQEQMRQTLIGIISQRLVPNYCPLCLGQCQHECNHLKYKRGAIMEILAGEDLQRYLLKGESTYESLNRKLRKAWMYGYISNETYHQFELV